MNRVERDTNIIDDFSKAANALKKLLPSLGLTPQQFHKATAVQNNPDLGTQDEDSTLPFVAGQLRKAKSSGMEEKLDTLKFLIGSVQNNTVQVIDFFDALEEGLAAKAKHDLHNVVLPLYSLSNEQNPAKFLINFCGSVADRVWMTSMGLHSFAEDPNQLPQMEAIKLVPFLENMADYLKRYEALQKGFSLDIGNIDPNLKISTSPSRLALFFLNAERNAAKHGEASKFQITGTQGNNFARLAISDDGTGIPHSILPNIFKEDFSGGKSTGLGLAGFDKFIQSANGSIEVTGNGGLPNTIAPSLQTGARFDLALPIVH